MSYPSGLKVWSHTKPVFSEALDFCLKSKLRPSCRLCGKLYLRSNFDAIADPPTQHPGVNYNFWKTGRQLAVWQTFWLFWHESATIGTRRERSSDPLGARNGDCCESKKASQSDICLSGICRAAGDGNTAGAGTRNKARDQSSGANRSGGASEYRTIDTAAKRIACRLWRAGAIQGGRRETWGAVGWRGPGGVYGRLDHGGLEVGRVVSREALHQSRDQRTNVATDAGAFQAGRD